LSVWALPPSEVRSAGAAARRRQHAHRGGRAEWAGGRACPRSV